METKDLAEKFGTVDFEGKTYTLTQSAHIEDVDWVAHAVDDDGFYYEVRWVAIDGRWDAWQRGDISDESDMCDWDNPVSVRLLPYHKGFAQYCE